MASTIRTAFLVLLVMTLVTGLAYPLLVTGIAQAVFPAKANGSLLIQGGRVIGSALIGQTRRDPRYFWGRPSATTPVGDNAAASTGSNLGPSNPELRALVGARMVSLRASDPGNTKLIPIDLVTASASGLDPDISPASALWQIDRIARLRGLPPKLLIELVRRQTTPRIWGVLGEPRVNVLLLNRALDALPSPSSGMPVGGSPAASRSGNRP